MDGNILIGFLDRSRLQLSGGSLTEPVSLDFSPGTMANLEVADRAGFSDQVKNWLAGYKIVPASLILVLADAVYFASELAGENTGKTDEEARLYAETVPFEDTLVKCYTVNKKTVVVVTNKELIESFQKILDGSGIALISVIPELILGPFGTNHWLDAPMGKYVKAHEDSLLGESMVEFEKTKAAVENSPKKVAGVNRLWIFLGIFVLLIVVLVFMILAH